MFHKLFDRRIADCLENRNKVKHVSFSTLNDIVSVLRIEKLKIFKNLLVFLIQRMKDCSPKKQINMNFHVNLVDINVRSSI